MKYTKLIINDPKTHNLIALSSDFSNPNPELSIKARFVISNSEIQSIKLDVINNKKGNYDYNLINAYICCNIISGAKYIYFLNFNFLEVSHNDVNEKYSISVQKNPSDCNLKLINSSTIFPNVNASADVNELTKCPKFNLTTIPETKDGTIIVSI